MRPFRYTLLFAPALLLAAPAAAQPAPTLSPGLHGTFQSRAHPTFHQPQFHQPGWGRVGHPFPVMPGHPGFPMPGFPVPGAMYPVPVWPGQGTVVVSEGAGAVRIERQVRVRQSPGVAIGGGVGNRGPTGSVMITLPQQIDHREVTTIETFPAGVDPRYPGQYHERHHDRW